MELMCKFLGHNSLTILLLLLLYGTCSTAIEKIACLKTLKQFFSALRNPVIKVLFMQPHNCHRKWKQSKQ